MGTCESRPSESQEILHQTQPESRLTQHRETIAENSPYFPNTGKHTLLGSNLAHQSIPAKNEYGLPPSRDSNYAPIVKPYAIIDRENSLYKQEENDPELSPIQRQVMTFGYPNSSKGMEDQEVFRLHPPEVLYSPPKNLWGQKKTRKEVQAPQNQDNKKQEHSYEESYNQQYGIEDDGEDGGSFDQVLENYADGPDSANYKEYFQPREINAERFSISRDSYAHNQSQDDIIHEGYLLKYKPGTNFNWVERWCVVTRKEFKYYKDQWTAKCWDQKPLLTIAISDIITTLRVNLSLPNFEIKKETLKAFKNMNLKQLYHFEVFDQRNDFLRSELDLPEEDERPSHRSTQGRRLSQELLQPSIKEGYLMRPPLTHRTFRKTQAKWDQNLSTAIDSSRSRNRSQSKNGSSERTTATGKVDLSTKWKKTKADLASWTGRENEWYDSEKRLLFGTPNSEDREKWVAILEWAVNEDDLAQ